MVADSPYSAALSRWCYAKKVGDVTMEAHASDRLDAICGVKRRSFVRGSVAAAGALALAGCSGAGLTAAQVAELDTFLTAAETIAQTIPALLPLLGVTGPTLIGGIAVAAVAEAVITAIEQFQKDGTTPSTGTLTPAQVTDAVTALSGAASLYGTLPTAESATTAKLAGLVTQTKAASATAAAAMPDLIALGGAVAALAPIVSSQLSAAKLAQTAARKGMRPL